MPALGTCQLLTNQEPNVEQSYCENTVGGVWTPNNPPIVVPTGICAVKTILVRALAENILQLGSSYHLTYIFRDEILSKSAVGKRMLRHYYAHTGELYSIVINDPEILAISIKAWTAAWPLVKGILECAQSTDPTTLSPVATKLRFTKASHLIMSRAIGKFRVATANKRLKDALDECGKLLRGYVGLTPQEALNKFLDGKGKKKTPVKTRRR